MDDNPAGPREPLPPGALADLTDMLAGDTDELVAMLGSFGLFEEIEQLSRLAILDRLQAATADLDRLAGAHPYCETFVELFETAGVAPESLGLKPGDVEDLDEMRREEGFAPSDQ